MNPQLSPESRDRAQHRLPTPSTPTSRRLKTIQSHSLTSMSVSRLESMIFSSPLHEPRQKPNRRRESKTTGPPMKDKFDLLLDQEIQHRQLTRMLKLDARNNVKSIKLKLIDGLFTSTRSLSRELNFLKSCSIWVTPMKSKHLQPILRIFPPQDQNTTLSALKHNRICNQQPLL